MNLPEWSVVKPKRRAHIERVAALVGEWADAAEVTAAEKERWVTAAWLHDALRDADPATLRPLVGDQFVDWPDKLLHGPAAAAQLRKEGFEDVGILRAVEYHTVGHPDFDDAGKALYLADFLEPGRTFDQNGRAALRARMPNDMNGVLREVLRARMAHLITAHSKMRRETVALWNSLAG